MTGQEPATAARGPAPDAILAIDAEGLLRALPGLPDELNAILRLADGRRTVRQIAEASGRPVADVSGALARLLDCGALRVADPGTPAPEAADWFAHPADPERTQRAGDGEPPATSGRGDPDADAAAPGTAGPVASGPEAPAPPDLATTAPSVLDAPAPPGPVTPGEPGPGVPVWPILAGPAAPTRPGRSHAWLAGALVLVGAAVVLGLMAGSRAGGRPDAVRAAEARPVPPAPPAAPPALAMTEPRTAPAGAEALARARERLAAGDLAAAAQACRQAIESDPASGPAWALLGEIHLAAGDAGRARAALERSLAVDPSGPAAPAARASLERLRP